MGNNVQKLTNAVRQIFAAASKKDGAAVMGRVDSTGKNVIVNGQSYPSKGVIDGRFCPGQKVFCAKDDKGRGMYIVGTEQ